MSEKEENRRSYYRLLLASPTIHPPIPTCIHSFHSLCKHDCWRKWKLCMQTCSLHWLRCFAVASLFHTIGLAWLITLIRLGRFPLNLMSDTLAYCSRY